MRSTRRTLAFGATALALLTGTGPAFGQSGRQNRVRGDAVWQATRALLQRTNLWRERTNLRTGSERLRSFRPARGGGTPPADAQVIAGTILGVAGMAINASRRHGEKVASNGEDLKGGDRECVR
jgi:hypothetical protein